MEVKEFIEMNSIYYIKSAEYLRGHIDGLGGAGENPQLERIADILDQAANLCYSLEAKSK